MTTGSTTRHLLIFDVNHIFVKKGSELFRPYAKELLSSLLEDTETYAVAIWAFCQKAKVDHVLDQLLTKEQKEQLLFVWDHDQCKQLQDFQTTRDLSHVWQEYPEFNTATTTIFLNDAKKVMDEYVDCVRILPSYGGPRKSKGDNVLENLKEQMDAFLLA